MRKIGFGKKKDHKKGKKNSWSNSNCQPDLKETLKQIKNEDKLKESWKK